METVKSMLDNAKKKRRVFKESFRIIVSEENLNRPNSVKHMNSKFAQSQKGVLKTIKRSPSNAEKLASENDVPSENYMEEDVFIPIHIRY